MNHAYRGLGTGIPGILERVVGGYNQNHPMGRASPLVGHLTIRKIETGNTIFERPVGTVPLGELAHLRKMGWELSYELLQHQHLECSWEIEPARRRGAIRAGRYVLAFTGRTDDDRVCDAVALSVASTHGLIGIDDVKRIAARTENDVRGLVTFEWHY
jgi:hypothetical protein